jgi:hypothetical protein
LTRCVFPGAPACSTRAGCPKKIEESHLQVREGPGHPGRTHCTDNWQESSDTSGECGERGVLGDRRRLACCSPDLQVRDNTSLALPGGTPDKESLVVRAQKLETRAYEGGKTVLYVLATAIKCLICRGKRAATWKHSLTRQIFFHCVRAVRGREAPSHACSLIPVPTDSLPRSSYRWAAQNTFLSSSYHQGHSRSQGQRRRQCRGDHSSTVIDSQVTLHLTSPVSASTSTTARRIAKGETTSSGSNPADCTTPWRSGTYRGSQRGAPGPPLFCCLVFCPRLPVSSHCGNARTQRRTRGRGVSGT